MMVAGILVTKISVAKILVAHFDLQRKKTTLSNAVGLHDQKVIINYFCVSWLDFRYRRTRVYVIWRWVLSGEWVAWGLIMRGPVGGATPELIAFFIFYCRERWWGQLQWGTCLHQDPAGTKVTLMGWKLVKGILRKRHPPPNLQTGENWKNNNKISTMGNVFLQIPNFSTFFFFNVLWRWWVAKIFLHGFEISTSSEWEKGITCSFLHSRSSVMVGTALNKQEMKKVQWFNPSLALASFYVARSR